MWELRRLKRAESHHFIKKAGKNIIENGKAKGSRFSVIGY
jgi:hypothetical protein